MASVVVVSASYDKQIRLWDATSGRTVKSFVFQDSQINSLFLLPDTGYLAVAGFGALRLYDLGTFLHSGGGAGTGSGAGTAHNCNNDEQSSTMSGSSRQLTDSTTSTTLNDQLLSTVAMVDTAALLGSAPCREAAFLLIATSEDGHIRFFDTRSAVTLRMLKDIATGAAITCSAVSPDRRYLLTGNQMGQVSMWHLPSIVASVALEMKGLSHHKAAAASKISDCSPITASGGAGTKAGEAQTAKAAAVASAEEERAKAFGRAPLQDINFANDYSAIRSIAIEPLGRWAAVATNVGKVHFIRLARDASVRGSKAATASSRSATQPLIIGVATSNDLPVTPPGQQDPHAMSLSGSVQPSPYKSPGKISASESTSGVPPLRLTLMGSASSYGEGGAANNSYHGPREAIYRSALVVNELSSNAQRASDMSGDGIGGELANTRSTPSGAASHLNSMGAVLLDHVEQQQNSNRSRSSCPGGHASAAQDAKHEQLAQPSAATKLAEQLEMEVFDTIQAHYKYILRVLISPNAELLVTCSADYSVGRFLVPAALRISSSTAASARTDTNAGSKSSALAAANAPSQPASTRPSGTRNGDEGTGESENVDSRMPCFVPTQALAPTTTDSSSPKETETAAAAAGNTNNAAAPDAAASGPLIHSFDGIASPGLGDGVSDESPQPCMEFQSLKPLTGHNRWVWDGVFSDCSNFLFTASSDNTLRMWNGLRTERPQSVSFVGHTKPVVAVLLCYDKRRLTLRVGQRHVTSATGSSNGKDGESNNTKDHADGKGGAVPPSATTTATGSAASHGFQGWKRFGSLTSGHQDTRDDEARRRATSARLTDMFADSARHSRWMQEQLQQSRRSSVYTEETAAPRLVRSSCSAVNANQRGYAVDEDEDGSAVSDAADATAPTALAATAGADVLEQELLDDNFLYYPPLAAIGEAGAAEATHTLPSGEPERYVPGQQVIPPGMTRYRVDVQYQGSDFDGWYKSVQRTRNSKDAAPAGNTATAAADYGTGSRHFAKVVLEEALAVALDVPTVSVVAAVIPETGVSVRRLTCHVDVPSEVELQPRTILQRATLWLHQRRQPLAVLSCHPCRNQDFHARHSGVRRVYCYRILNRIAPPLFDAGLQWHVDRYLDVPRMQRMARLMEGTHDYGFFADSKMANALRRAAASSTGSGRGGPVVSSAYSAEHERLTSHGLRRGEAPAAPKVTVERGLSQLERAAALPTFNEYGQRVITYQAKPHEYHKARTNLPTIRTLDKIEVVRQEDEVLIWFVGQSFLRHQIRNMVSALKAGGHGLWDDQELQHAFQSGFEVSRKKFKRERLSPAPAHGLTLWDVEYPTQHRSDFVPYVDAGPYEPVDVSTQH
ncbi:WD domain, G-beta repeat family protein [Leishmania donovani]|uniref:WD domain, G-beta repeat family protein n=2 Tax=Leishmania donovani TaxID=5661 RepID=A0A504XUJ0_LEIDO|nr:WD domain, G-beta repeat family protein [Leishmania donovani]